MEPILVLLSALVLAVVSYVGTRSYAVGNADIDVAREDVGTITLSSDATLILGFWAVGAVNTQTTVEANIANIQYTLDGQLILGPWTMGAGQESEGAATNEGANWNYPDFWPYAIPKSVPREGGAIGSMTVVPNGSNGALGTPTNGYSVVAGVVTWEGPVQDVALLKELQMAFQQGYELPFRNGARSTSAALITADASALAAITVRSDADVVVGMSQSLVIDGVGTAGVEAVGWVDYTSTISDFGTQQYPFSARSANLGTPVGRLVDAKMVRWPAWIPTVQSASSKRATWTITPTVQVNATIDTAHPDCAAFWR